LSTDLDAPLDTNIIIIALAGGLSILFVLLMAVIICIFVRSKKKPQRESDHVIDRLYDTINIGHPPPVNETELNIAYRHPKK
jgi:hypothetical protein